jgi:hypothetical protein
MAAATMSKPTQTEASTACSYESAGWSCRSTGYLWFSETRTGEEKRYPCPRCNSILFVKVAESRARRDVSEQKCICCEPSVTSLALEYALQEVAVQRQFVCLPR